MFNYDEANRVIEMAKIKIAPSLMIVFGSVANGTAGDDSDLDLVLVKESDENSFISGAEARLALKDSRIPVDIIIYTPEEFRRDRLNKHSLAYKALSMGWVVHGSIDMK